MHDGLQSASVQIFARTCGISQAILQRIWMSSDRRLDWQDPAAIAMEYVFYQQGASMRKTIVVLAIVCLPFIGSVANAKGCIAGAAVGGVAGHVAGKHGLLGAAAGCAVGRHRANKKDAAKSEASQAAQAPADKQ